MTIISKGSGRPLAAFDLDSTLADTSQRLHYIKPASAIDPVTGKKAKKDWKRFFAEAVNDAPLTEGIALLQRLAEDHEIVFLTGRPEHCRADTEAWIRQHTGVEPTTLYMRRPGVFTPSAVEKTELLRMLAAEGREIAVIVDDDITCVESYRREGFEVIHATWAPTDAALARAQQVEGRV